MTRKADMYGPGKSYNIFAGKDGSRGLALPSLKPEHAIADYSDLSDRQLKVLMIGIVSSREFNKQTAFTWLTSTYCSKRYNIVDPPAATPPTSLVAPALIEAI